MDLLQSGLESVLAPGVDYHSTGRVSRPSSGRSTRSSFYRFTFSSESLKSSAFQSRQKLDKNSSNRTKISKFNSNSYNNYNSSSSYKLEPKSDSDSQDYKMFASTTTTHSTSTIPHSRVSRYPNFTESNLYYNRGPLIFPFGEENTIVIDFKEAKKSEEKGKEFSGGRPKWIYSNIGSNFSDDDEDKENSDAPRSSRSFKRTSTPESKFRSHLAPGAKPDPFRDYLAPGRSSAFCPVAKNPSRKSSPTEMPLGSSRTPENSSRDRRENSGNSRSRKTNRNDSRVMNKNKLSKPPGFGRGVGSNSPSPTDFKVDKSHPKYKTEKCVNYPMGHCKFGDNCAFIHA